MNEEEYLNHRLDEQLRWYDKKSQYNQKCFKYLRLAEIISAAVIPYLSGLGDKLPHSSLVIGGLGVVIAVAAAAISLFKYQENWVQYRATAEQLRHEKYLYLTGTTPYTTEEKLCLLVQRVEGTISKENYSWVKVANEQLRESKKT